MHVVTLLPVLFAPPPSALEVQCCASTTLQRKFARNVVLSTAQRKKALGAGASKPCATHCHSYNLLAYHRLAKYYRDAAIRATCLGYMTFLDFPPTGNPGRTEKDCVTSFPPARSCQIRVSALPRPYRLYVIFQILDFLANGQWKYVGWR